MSLARFLEKQGGPAASRESTPAAESGERLKSAGLSRWANESTDPSVARALAALRDLKPSPEHTGRVLHPFPVKVNPAYKSLPEGEMHALIHSAPVKKVPLATIHSNGQRSVKPEHVAQYVRSERPDDQPSKEEGGKRGPPIVVHEGDDDVIFDGHHRATAALLKGETSINARYVDLDARRTPE